MAVRDYHLQSQRIPEGFQIFEERLDVAGLRFRRDDAIAFAKKKSGWLELEREGSNKHDPNAIKVIGCYKGLFGVKRRFIGYVPKEVSAVIVDRGLWGDIQPRLLKTFVGDSGFVEILFQLLGPKEKKYVYTASNPRGIEKIEHDEKRLRQLKAEKRHDEAIELLLRLIDETEKEAKALEELHSGTWGVAPAWYEQLAIIYRKEKRHADEVEILERYASQPKGPGAGPQKLAERLVKARQLLEKQRR